MKKAERIFRDTRAKCANHIDAWGKQTNPNGMPVGFTGMIYGDETCLYSKDDHCTSIRTCNDIQKVIDSEKKRIAMNFKYGIINNEKYEDNLFILDMVQVCLNNQIKTINEFNAI